MTMMRDASPVARSAWLSSVMDLGPKAEPLIRWRRPGKVGMAVLVVLVLAAVWVFMGLTPSVVRGDHLYLRDLAAVSPVDGVRRLDDPPGGATTFVVEIRNASPTTVQMGEPQTSRSEHFTVRFRPVTAPPADPSTSTVPGEPLVDVPSGGVVEAVVTLSLGCGRQGANSVFATSSVDVWVRSLGLSTAVRVPLGERLAVRTTSTITTPCP